MSDSTGSAARQPQDDFEPQVTEPGQQFGDQQDVKPQQGQAGKKDEEKQGKTEEGKPLPPQAQETQPGRSSEMTPKPKDHAEDYLAAGKLEGKVALITGGDSGIGRSVAVHYAKEGADVCVLYLNEHEDAKQTQKWIEAEGRRCLLIAGDIGDPDFCASAVQQCVDELGGLNILVNNAAEQHEAESLEDISNEQLERTFRTNIFAMFYLAKAALPHMGEDDAIINTTSITAYQGYKTLMDYASTKGAIVAFTRSLAGNLAEQKIRVNAVAPGPIWTPLIPASFDAEKVAEHGSSAPLGRVGQPDDCAPAYVYLASRDSAYVTGQTLHVNGGSVVNG
jgi:NAD(P)-dependent dehydrogenase (short-subunit alcohol dehydrogenase family)